MAASQLCRQALRYCSSECGRLGKPGSPFVTSTAGAPGGAHPHGGDRPRVWGAPQRRGNAGGGGRRPCWLQFLDGRLALTGGWLAAGQFSIADVACISGVLFCSNLLGMDLKAEYPHLAAWLDAALARPAVRRGLNTPDPCPFLAGEADAGRKQMLEAARGRVARLGLQLGAEA
ncbi:hypothetical protein ABPG77_001026 [Micractinium sp. CCAP 211/92]